MGQSDFIILAVSLLGFAFIGYFLFSLTKQKSRGHDDAHHHEEDDRDGDQHRPRGNARRRRGGGAVNNEEDGGDDDGGEEENGNAEPDLSGMTKKEIAKVEKRRAKAQQREAMEAEREERKEREEARMELLRERELEKDEEFARREEERRRELAAEEQRRRDAYNHWKDPFPDHVITFPTDPFSSDAASAVAFKDSENTVEDVMVGEIVTFIKEAKVCCRTVCP
jgi:hypothetical protein